MKAALKRAAFCFRSTPTAPIGRSAPSRSAKIPARTTSRREANPGPIMPKATGPCRAPRQSAVATFSPAEARPSGRTQEVQIQSQLPGAGRSDAGRVSRPVRRLINLMEATMFLIAFFVLLVLWAMGFLAFHVAGGLIHLLVVLAVISLIVHL